MATVNPGAPTMASTQKAVSAGKKEKNQNIQVVVRCRPINSTEKKMGAYNIVEICPERREVNVKERTLPTAPVKTFSYDKVFPASSKQIELYKTVVVPILEEVLMGYNCTIFAYGQTGTGKTFTMEGERTDDPSVSWEEDPLAGIIPRAMNQLFSRLQKQGCEFTVRVSFLEIYNEELIDLLGAESVENPRLKIYEDNVKKGACVISGLEEVVVNSRDQVYQILQQGAAKRQTASTLLNAHSSRSHTLFMVTIHIKENSIDGEELLKTGKLNLVDLAGSECIGRSGAVDKRAREAGNINQSLLTLGRVITALVEHAPHIPYRESKLTRLLQDSLGGRTKTSIIATISPASVNMEETLSTLDYAFRARNITNKPEINQKLTKKALLKEYTEEMERLRRDLQAARDKNGIYLAEENYIAIQTQLAQQHDNIKDLEEKISVCNLEIFKLTDMFTETKEELEATTKELQKTEKTLELTSNTLHVTKVKLSKTTMEREEQKHLVSVHVKTEQKLHSQATQLLQTADVSTSDVAGLHAKLDRKRNVENQNASVQQNFQARYNASVDDFRDRLNEFAAQQQQFASTVHTGIGSALSQRTAEVSKMSSALSSLISLISQRSGHINTVHEQYTTEFDDGLEKLGLDCSQFQGAECGRISEFHQQVIASSLCAIQSSLNKLVSDLNHLEALHSQQMQEQQLTVTQFVEEQLKTIDSCQDIVVSFAEEQDNLLSQHAQDMRQFLNEQKVSNQNHTKKVMETLAAALKEMDDKQDACLTAFVHKATSEVDNIQKKSTTFKTDSEQLLVALGDVSEDGRSKLLSCTSQHHESSKQMIDDMVKAVDSTNSNVKLFNEQLSEFCTKSQNTWTTAADTMLSDIHQQKQVLNKALVNQHSAIQKLQSDVGEEVGNLDARQRSEYSLLESKLKQQQELVSQTSSEVEEWNQQTEDTLEEYKKLVDTFLNSELRKDVATGTTPQRREFEYPRILSKTSPHPKIVEQFRKKYIEQEAVETALPGDDIDDDNSVEQRTISAFSLDDDENQVDNHLNVSGDSAISSVSAVSSNCDKQTAGEDKENVMKKPSFVPPKTRGTLKSATTTPKGRVLSSSNRVAMRRNGPLSSSTPTLDK